MSGAGHPGGEAPVLQARLPFAPWADPRTRRLPGTLPLAMADWLVADDAYGAQMALRDRLIAAREAEVHACLPAAAAAAAELWDMVLPLLPGLGLRAEGGAMRRPDGVSVPLDPARPLRTLGRLVQEDICILQPGGGGEHVLTAAILCFPAGWRLDEKLGRPLMRMHAPVARYTPEVGARVQRLMDGIRPGAPLWRANAHFSRAPLFNPHPEGAPREAGAGDLPWIRSERQCLLRLPQSGAMVFTIHTWVVARGSLTPGQAAALAEHPIHGAA